MPVIFVIFLLISLLYIFRAGQILLQIRNEWQSLHEEPLTRTKKHLADQASFYIGVPPGVAIHEFCHVLGVWLFGGHVARFFYGVFFGYVVPVENFTGWQNWFIAVAGTLGNLAYGAVVYFALRNHKSSSFRFFGLRTFRFQIYFALLYYPIFTLFIPSVSDWRIIYDFSATPIISGVTAVLHITALILFFIADRHGRFEMPSFDSAQVQENFFELEKSAQFSPQIKETQLQYLATLYDSGAQNKAKHKLKQYMKEHPNFAKGWLLLAQIETEKTVSKDAYHHVQKALQLGLSENKDKAVAHMLLGRYLAKADLERAKEEMDIAINTAVPKQGPEQQAPHDLLFFANLYYWRSQVYGHKEDFIHANDDIQTAIQFAQIAKSDTAVTYYQKQQAIINNQAGMKRPN